MLGQPYDLHGSELFARGALMPQSRASMLVARAVDPQPGERVLDLCAAPGGKTTHLAALMRGEGEVVAVELDAKRARDVARNAERLGAAQRARSSLGDAAEPAFGTGYDRVLVDPPCSDLGTLRSRPDARWRKTPAQVAELAALQARILDAAVEALRPGGRLVYSTCTISPRENELQIEALHGPPSRPGSGRPPGRSDFASPRPHGRVFHRDIREDMNDVPAGGQSQPGAGEMFGPDRMCPGCGEPWLRPDPACRALPLRQLPRAVPADGVLPDLRGALHDGADARQPGPGLRGLRRLDAEAGIGSRRC